MYIYIYKKPEEKFEFSLLMHEIKVLPIKLLGRYNI